MTDSSDTSRPAPPRVLVQALRAFAADHGGSATAVVAYLGRVGARIVLVGADGTWGDQMAPDVEIAGAACAEAGVTVADGWGRELTESVRTSGYEWGLMGRNRPVGAAGGR